MFKEGIFPNFFLEKVKYLKISKSLLLHDKFIAVHNEFILTRIM